MPFLAAGHVTRAEWFTYIEQHYTSSAERDALFSIVEAQIQMAFLFVRRATRPHRGTMHFVASVKHNIIPHGVRGIRTVCKQ